MWPRLTARTVWGGTTASVRVSRERAAHREADQTYRHKRSSCCDHSTDTPIIAATPQIHTRRTEPSPARTDNTPSTLSLGVQTRGCVATPPIRRFEKNAPDRYEPIYQRQCKAHSSRRIPVERGIAHLKDWRSLSRHVGRREHMSHTIQVVGCS
jgi:hypothetical protein